MDRTQLFSGFVSLTPFKIVAILTILVAETGVILYNSPNLFVKTPSQQCSGLSPEIAGYPLSADLLNIAFAIEHNSEFIAMTGGRCFELSSFYTFFDRTGSYPVLVFNYYFGVTVVCGRGVDRMIVEQYQITPRSGGSSSFKVVGHLTDVEMLNMRFCPAQ